MPPHQPPHIVSWNVTCQCLLRCLHCYGNAGNRSIPHELNMAEGKSLLSQLSDAGTRIVVLSGGEPLLRKDIFDLARFGTGIGLRMAMGTSGVCVTDDIAQKIRESGIRKVAVSLDSTNPSVHDQFRGCDGAFDNTVRGISCLKDEGIPVQLNVTVTRDNDHEIPGIIRFGKELAIRDIHLFFLVPTGRGSMISDISPDMYEQMIREALILSTNEGITVRPTCAPQFMRIAREIGLSRKEWKRGCIAGRSYCRVDSAGAVTPCPYLPVEIGNCTHTPFREIWENSPLLEMLRDNNRLEGKCGRCEYVGVCGGCRARAYSLSRLVPSICGDMDCPGSLTGNIMAEEPWCPYQPSERLS